MAPKQRTTAPAATTSSAAAPSTPAARSKADAQDIVSGVWSRYTTQTTSRVKLLDSFMGFLVAVGALQFLYVVIVGNFVRPRPAHAHAHTLYNCHMYTHTHTHTHIEH
jgi:oligosaccharyltransferase complex subunit epsilon